MAGFLARGACVAEDVILSVGQGVGPFDRTAIGDSPVRSPVLGGNWRRPGRSSVSSAR